MKRIEKDGKFYRMRRGKLVEIPAEWVGQVCHPQEQRKRKAGAKMEHDAKHRARANKERDAVVKDLGTTVEGMNHPGHGHRFHHYNFDLDLDRRCSTCNGTGKVEVVDGPGVGRRRYGVDCAQCPSCRGTRVKSIGERVEREHRTGL
jgi:hypothetical protein